MLRFRCYSSLKNPCIRLGLVLGLEDRPETLLFILYPLVSSKMPDCVVLARWVLSEMRVAWVVF